MTTVRLNEQQLREVQRILSGIEDGASRALAAALNKTAAKAKTLASKKIRERIRLKAGYVRERLKGPNDTPANKATFSNLSAKISAPHRGLLLSHFLGKGTSTPVSRKAPKVKVKPSGSYQKIATRPGNVSKSFLIRLRGSGLTGIAQRMPDGRIDVLHGPSLSQVLQSRGRLDFQTGSTRAGVIDEIGPELGDMLAETLDSEVQRVLARFG